MMGTDNITCPSEGPVAGCAVGVLASAGRRDFGPQLAAVRVSCGLGPGSLGWFANAVARRTADHRLPGGTPCAGEPHARGGRGREETRWRCPAHEDRRVVCRWRASRLPHCHQARVLSALEPEWEARF